MPAQKTYLIIDGAKTNGKISDGLQINPVNKFLSDTGSDKKVNESGIVFDFQFLAPFAEWFQSEGFGKAWGIFAISNLSIDELIIHLRKFLNVNSADDKEIGFRLHDPRVLRVFLPTCDAEELKKIFGPVKMYAMESEDSNFIIQFEILKNHLVSTRIPATEFWNSSNNFSDAENPVIQAKNDHDKA
ncbi:MAG TPA: DUF4123 domain-containing protein, partial [Bacteroidia bacterium]|nr:DUF4123 domain-containing protein [Bacteroidia bacterium]